jgi:hypothetical protein
MSKKKLYGLYIAEDEGSIFRLVAASNSVQKLEDITYTRSHRWYICGETERKNRSINKGLDFELDYEWVCSQLKNNVCPVTKLPFYLGKEPRHPMTPSIDKIDPNKGYTKKNCRVICYWYNTEKSNYSEETVMSLCEAVVKAK